MSSGAGAFADIGGRAPDYGVSEAALNALAIKLAVELSRHGILANAVRPGWVPTDMGGGCERPVADGAKGVVWAATLPDSGTAGDFFRNARLIDMARRESRNLRT